MIHRIGHARRGLAALAAALLVLVSLAATQGTATSMAATDPPAAVTVAPAMELVALSDCPASSGGLTVVGCYFRHANYGTPLWIVTTSQGCKNVNAANNDTFSSVWNRTVAGSSGAYLMRIWVDGNCSGQSAHHVPGRQDSQFSWFWNDAASSYAVYPCSAVAEC